MKQLSGIYEYEENCPTRKRHGCEECLIVVGFCYREMEFFRKLFNNEKK